MKKTSSKLSLLTALPGVGAVFLPAVSCPACWPAYAGLLSSLGVSFIDYSPWLIPVITLLVFISLLSLFWQCRNNGDYRSFMLGLVGSVILALGKFQFESDNLVYLGAGVLVIASIWNAWPRGSCQVSSSKNNSEG